MFIYEVNYMQKQTKCLTGVEYNNQQENNLNPESRIL